MHLHSKYSRAVSQKMVPEVMEEWAVKKGVDILASGDWTHPLWLKELEAKLKEMAEGVFSLKKGGKTRFVLVTEISSIYSQDNKLRRVHTLVMAPSFKTVNKINEELKRRGCNLLSDGRPIIGLSCIQLAELVWTVDKDAVIVPAHVWTPWFSVYGSKSGFDSIKECFGEFSDRIMAVETGLSSDPAMNWRIKELDSRQIISSSDAHSPQKMAREATVLEVEKINFKNLMRAITKPDEKNKISYTIEFHPEEGKYHYTGHRNCGIRQSPEETKQKGATCPVCGKMLTVGVMHRVEELAARTVTTFTKTSESGLVGHYNKNNSQRPPYVMLVPLMEILAEINKTVPTSQKVINEYENLTKKLGSEIKILTQIKTEEISKTGGQKLAEAIKKVRKEEIFLEPGYDGVFGTVKIWPKTNKDIKINTKEQMTIF